MGFSFIKYTSYLFIGISPIITYLFSLLLCFL
nr:MAG TPA: hypothetical protein [Bacteriophage sp.]